MVERGMTEAYPPIEVKGESRQTVVSLPEAEAAIPELKQLLDLAGDQLINLVVISDTDRFRGLLDQVVRVLGQYGCQIYSLAQPVELTSPDRYRYYNNDAQILSFGVAQLTSHADIARFVRKHRDGMATRIDERGLPPAAVPFGYRKPAGREMDRTAIPVKVPAECAILQRMRSDYMAGHTQAYIAGWLNREGVPTPTGKTWLERSVMLMLVSPFYAGLLRRNTVRTHSDPRTRKRIYKALPPEEWIFAQGKHEPLWSLEDHQAILDAKAMRAPDRHGAPRSQAFSRLLKCAHCDAILHAWQPVESSGYADRRLRYICSQQWAPPHAVIFADTVARDLRAVLAETIKAQLASGPAIPALPDAELAQIARSLEECEAKRTRHENAHGDGLMTMERLRARLADVDAEESDLLKRRSKIMDTSARVAAAGLGLTRAQEFLDNYDAYMAGPAKVANAALRLFLDHAACTRGGVVRVKLVS